MSTTTIKRRKGAKPKSRNHRPNKSTIVLRVWQVADELTLSEREVYQLIQDGALRGTRVSEKRVVVHKDDLAEYVARCRGITPVGQGQDAPKVRELPA